MREPTEAENEAAAEEFYRGAPCPSRYNGNNCDLDAGHTTPHSSWIEGYGNLTWAPAEADPDRTEDPAPDGLPARYRFNALVERGFSPSDAEKVEAFARRLMDSACSCTDADSLFCEGAEHSGTGECVCPCHDAGRSLDAVRLRAAPYLDSDQPSSL